LEELLNEYLRASGLGAEPGSPLFPAALGKTGKISRRPLVRTDAADMLKRRLKQAGLPAHYSPHSFRATGITNFLENDGTLEAAQRIAGHADSRTTKLYDRRGQKVLLEDMERNAELGISLQMPSTIKCGVIEGVHSESGLEGNLLRILFERPMSVSRPFSALQSR
jgi:integrase